MEREAARLAKRWDAACLPVRPWREERPLLSLGGWRGTGAQGSAWPDSLPVRPQQRLCSLGSVSTSPWEPSLGELGLPSIRGRKTQAGGSVS